METEKPNKTEFIDKTLDDYFGLILPDNERTRRKVQNREEIKKRKMEEEYQRRMEEEQALNVKNEKLQRDEMERLRRQKELQDAQQNYEKYADAVEKGEGNLNEIFSTILRNTSAYELSFHNYNMDNTWEFRLLMTILERNTSLLTLNLSRKNLDDRCAEKIAVMLTNNKKLRRLELEGNFFGPASCKEFAKAVKSNNTLRYLDLENNNLTDHGKDTQSIHELFIALQSNTMLISLNLSNNHFTSEIGAYIVEMLRKNKTIIHFEFFDNKDFEDRPTGPERKDDESKFKSKGLYINQIETIKELLKENNDAYMKMRTDEWNERKRMTNNYEDNLQTKVELEARKFQEETRKKEQEYIEMLYLDNFNQRVKEMEDDFNNKVNQYYAETKERMAKKKKKKGGKKKKK